MVEKINRFIFGICLLSSSYSAISGPQINNKFINPYQVYYTSEKLNRETIEDLAKYDLVVLERSQYMSSLNNNTWAELKSKNPEIIITLYQNGSQVAENTDHLEPLFLDNIGRFNIARGNPEGSISDNPEWFLKNELGDIIKDSVNSESLILDYGNPAVVDYWLKSTNDDIVNTPWKADGVMVDNLKSFKNNTTNDPSRLPAKYPDPQTNNNVTNTFINDITTALHNQGQIVVPNRTNSRSAEGEAAWVDLDSRTNPPDIILEEGAFAVNWGAGDVQFYSLDDWLRQITIPQKIKNSSVAFLSHTDLGPGQTGIDSDGNEVNFNQIFWYSLGSYLLAKNDEQPTLFSFDYDRDANGDYKRISWFDIYTELDLGQALEETIPANVESNSIYMREFEKGYVYVNPLSSAISNIPSPSSEALKVDFSIDGTVLSEGPLANDHFSIDGHSTVILLKAGQTSSVNSSSTIDPCAEVPDPTIITEPIAAPEETPTPSSDDDTPTPDNNDEHSPNNDVLLD